MDEDIVLGGKSGRDYRTEIPLDEDELYEDGTQFINLRKYQHLIPYIVVFIIVVALVRGAMPKRDRKGCTLVVLFAFIIYYFFNRCVHL